MKGIHAHPELSHHEEHTAALLAGELRKAGYTVTERVGRYPDGTQACGVVAILQNGPGPRLLIRAAMDAAKFAAAQAAGKSLPGPHNSHFEPNPELTLRTGVTAMSSVAIALLQK
jgi:metal-dependent amidase/aminoacylase/carboxypeptidase family protein